MTRDAASGKSKVLQHGHDNLPSLSLNLSASISASEKISLLPGRKTVEELKNGDGPSLVCFCPFVLPA